MKSTLPDSHDIHIDILVITFCLLFALIVITEVAIADEPSGPGKLPGVSLAPNDTKSEMERATLRSRQAMMKGGLEHQTENSIMIFTAQAAEPPNIFYGAYETNTQGTIEIHKESGAFAWKGSNNYVGFWHSPTLDLSGFKKLEFELKSETANGACVDIRIEDVVPGQETGHVYRSGCLDLTEEFKKYQFTADDFNKYPYFGEQEGSLDWSQIKNIQVQIGSKSEYYYPYHGTYHDKGNGSITILETDSAFAWHGHNCYFGFSLMQPIDLTQLKEVRAKLKGAGKIDLLLIDDKKVSYYVHDMRLGKKSFTHKLEKGAFKLFPYNSVGVIDWTNIKNIQIQASTPVGARVAIEHLAFELRDGTTHLFDANSVDETYMALRAIHVVFNERPVAFTDEQRTPLLTHHHPESPH